MPSNSACRTITHPGTGDETPHSPRLSRAGRGRGGRYWRMGMAECHYGRGGDIPAPLRTVLGFNERVARGVLFSDQHLVKTYPHSAIGLSKEERRLWHGR